MRMVYSEVLLDHFEQPRHVGELDAEAADVGTGQVGSMATGGVLRIQIQVDENHHIVAARFKSYGPPALIAAGSWLAEAIQNGRLDDAEAFTQHDVIAALELPPARIHCAMLAEDAIRAAIHNFKDKQRAYV